MNFLANSINEPLIIIVLISAFPDGSVVKNPPAKAGDAGLIPGLGRSPGGGNSNPLQHACLEKPLDRGSWWAILHRVAKGLDMA